MAIQGSFWQFSVNVFGLAWLSFPKTKLNNKTASTLNSSRSVRPRRWAATVLGGGGGGVRWELVCVVCKLAPKAPPAPRRARPRAALQVNSLRLRRYLDTPILRI